MSQARTNPAVLIIAAYFPPNPASGAARPGRFAKYLPEFGYDPIVISQAVPEVTGEAANVRRVPALSPRLTVRIRSGVSRSLQRYFLPYDDRLPWVAHALAEAEAVLEERRISVILSTSPPIATHLVARKLKHRHRIPWVADFRDPLQGNPFRSRKWPFPYDAILERRLFRSADALIANTDSVAEMWRGRHGKLAEKTSVLWNGFDPDDRVDVVPETPGGCRVLSHVGSLYGGRHPGRILTSIRRLIDVGKLLPDRIMVRLVGPYDNQCLRGNESVMDALRALGCLDCDGKQVSKAEARHAGAQSDYLLLLDLNEHDADLQVPAKLFEYIQFGRPILALTRRDSPTDRILRRSGVPFCAVYDDSTDEDVDSEVQALFNLPVEPVKSNDWYEQTFNVRNQTRTLAKILDSVRETA
jgi:glycosyltransferase involved in cell wall biosynthesis